MSIEFRAVKRLGALRPATDHDAALMQDLPEGTPIKLVATVRPRNEAHHRWFFGLLGVVADNTEYTTDQLLLLVKIGIGHVDTIIHPVTGAQVLVPRSISFAKMDQQQFTRFANDAVNFIITRYLPGVSNQELEREVFERVGIDLSNLRDRRAA